VQQITKAQTGTALSPAPVYDNAPRGAEILIQALLHEGVKHIFGLPGGAVLHIYDELWRARHQITHYLVRHEQGAIHAADGYARATGQVGVALVTSGPGATNAVTGIATAYMDSVPLVVITGQVPTPLIGTDAFQEVDTIGITRPCVKHNYLVRDARDLAATVREAFYLAREGRPGPVVIDIPKDVTAQTCNYSRLSQTNFPFIESVYPPKKREIKAAAAAIMRAKRPVMYVGGGVVTSGAADLLKAFAEEFEMPVTPTLMGLGGFPSAHELCLGMLGMHGTFTANNTVRECDLLLAVGARFDDRVTGKLATFAPNATIVHIDIDPANIGKNVKPHFPIAADARSALKALLDEMRNYGSEEIEKKRAERADWWKRIREWQSLRPLSYRNTEEQLKPQSVIEELYEITNGEAIIVTDVGQHQMWAAQFYPFKRSRQWITSGGLGTMGFGLPAAMGAQLALPDEQVIAVVGDGGFQMTNQEISTAVQYEIPLKVLIMNNGYLGMVRQWQELFYDRAYSEVDLSVAPDFVMLAEAFGVGGYRASAPGELRDALKAWLDHPGTAVFDAVVTQEENVFPIVPAGADAHQMMFENDGV
jgi:acetolactate synthase-1/2/3 large subunit